LFWGLAFIFATMTPDGSQDAWMASRSGFSVLRAPPVLSTACDYTFLTPFAAVAWHHKP
jgi:hypothetical protein